MSIFEHYFLSTDVVFSIIIYITQSESVIAAIVSHLFWKGKWKEKKKKDHIWF